MRTSTYGGAPRSKICAPKKKKDGYVEFGLSKNGKVRYRKAHRLSWEAFNGPVPPDLELNHKNGDKADNRLENLEVCTRSENQLHSYGVLGNVSKGRGLPGEGNGSSKLTDEKVREIRRLYNTGLFQYQIAPMFGISQRLVSLITRREIWRHVE